jgi:hypothetical protein
MMSAVMAPPVDSVVVRGAMMADDARAIHGQNPAAATSSDKGGIHHQKCRRSAQHV